MVDDPTKLNSRDVARRDVGRGDATSISPRMTALFGAIFGLATMASVFALLIQVFPVTPTAEQAPSEPSSSASTNVAGEREIAGQRPQRKLLPGPWRVSALKSSHQVVTGTMNRRSFIKALAESGVPKGEIYRILKAMEGVRKFDRTGKDDLFTVALARGTNKVAAFEYQVDPTAVYQARTNENGLLRGLREAGGGGGNR